MGALLALDGIKILDFSRTEPGSFCSMVLGDLGADVIMIEAPPAAGARAVGFRQAIPGGTARKHRRYRAVNRNKRSISLNLKSEKARHIFYRLAEETDVIIEGFRPGVAERLGIDYRTVSRMNPGIVYCSMTGYGQDGPYSNLAGHDLNCIALGGALSLIGGKDGKPVIPLNLIADIGGGAMFAAVGILAALIARQSTGRGQHIDISLTDSVISLLTTRAAEYFEHGVVPGRGETTLGGAYPYYNVYETADGKFIALACIEPWLWEEFCREIGREDFIPFHFQLEHMYHLAEGKEWENITSFLKQLFKTRSSDEWFGLFNQKDMPVSRVHSLSEVFVDPQVLHRQMVAELEDPVEGRIKQAGIAIKLSDTPGRIRSLPPTSGEHTEEILTEIGYSQHSIAELRQETVIG
jgi:crotonobetainyl-CoA:carnitine CoA-transferase CaiB-like acyl-CoA transferase